MKDMHAHSSVPALERGLAILELLARKADGVAFQAILDTLAFPKATVARLLRVLRDHGYVIKHPKTGLYRLGPSAALLGHGVSPLDVLLTHSGGILDSLCDRTKNTAALFFWSGKDIMCLDKRIAPAAVSMREVGHISTDMENAPWSWVLWNYMDEAQRSEALQRMEEKTKFHRILQKQVIYFAEHEYAFDDEQLFKHVRRLAAPVFDADGIVGCLALGGNLLTIPDGGVDAMGRTLVKHAKKLTRNISGQWRKGNG